ncbi:hypothetical protein KP509_1Z119900 [Ceratopteris richardii]|nr:hypothetical protein KP509_1Z119900 [Ceratopteris richardii]
MNSFVLLTGICFIDRYLALFLNEHAKEVYSEVFMAYIDTLKKVLIEKFRTYIQSLEKMQLDVATVNDLIGVQDTKRLQLFSRSKEPLKNRSSVFSLGNRDKILKELEQPALIAHIVEAKGEKYPYEVLFRSLHKLLMDTATSEYLFCHSFFGDDAIFLEIFAGPFGVIDEHLNSVLPNNYDAIGLMLMIRITHQHQLIMSRRRIPCFDPYLDKVNLMLWPRFKMVFDLHLSSIRSANIWALWENDVHAHYVMRRYAEFTTSLLQLNVEYGDGQLDSNLDRLRLSVDDLLIKIARCFKHQKQQTIFLINNYDMEAGIRESRTQQQFEELLKSSQTVFLEAILLEHFPQLIMFVKTRTGDNTASSSRQPIKVEEVEPLIKGFAERWKRDFGLIHEEIITSFSNLLCGMEILRLTLTQFLLYYSRFSDVVRQIDVGDVLKVKLVSVNSIMYEMKNYSRTF